MTLSKNLLLSIILVLLFGALFFLWNLDSKMPNVTFTTLENKKIETATLKGKVVLVNFWATDCKSCVEEMPELINTYNKYKNQGFELIAVAMPYDPPAQVFNYATQKKLPFPVMHDGFAEISQKFGNISVTPTAFVFDKNGKRLLKTTGTLDFKKLEALLNTHL